MGGHHVHHGVTQLQEDCAVGARASHVAAEEHVIPRIGSSQSKSRYWMQQPMRRTNNSRQPIRKQILDSADNEKKD